MLWRAGRFALAAMALIGGWNGARAAQAVIVIDDFNTTEQWFYSATDDSMTASAPEALGGQRDLELILTPGAPPFGPGHFLGVNYVNPSNLVGSGRLQYFETNGNGAFRATWSGGGPGGLGGIDLTEADENNALELVLKTNHALAVTITLFSSLGDASVLTHLIDTGNVFEYVPFRFEHFVTQLGGGADLTSITAIELFVAQGPLNSAFELDEIRATFVPEPATWMLVLGAAVGLGLFARRRAK